MAMEAGSAGMASLLEEVEEEEGSDMTSLSIYGDGAGGVGIDEQEDERRWWWRKE